MTSRDYIAQELGLSKSKVEATLDLLKEGATVPFMARYRKEKTGGLDEEQLRSICRLHEEFKKLESRRETIVGSLQDQNLYHGQLKKDVDSAATLTELEDLYLPHKPKRKTRAGSARELGLEPLARLIVKQPSTPDPNEAASRYLGAGVKSVQEALSGAQDIVAEWAAESPRIRTQVRDKSRRFGRLRATKKKGAEDPKNVYESYYEFENLVPRIRPHQVLALDRGEREKVLKVSLETQERDWRDAMRREFRPAGSAWTKYLEEALEDGAKRLLLPSIEREIRKELTEHAQQHAIQVFGDNLESLLLVPPLDGHTVLGLDPGFRSGCKLAGVDPTGKLLFTDTIYPHPPQKQEKQSLDILARLIKKHRVTLVAIGNGTASRESEQLVAQLDVPYLIVSEAGASVYSASPLAKKEFPNLDVSLRGAVSIARRVQDPLAELIKIDPKSVGVGMYQHDLNEAQLDEALAQVVESVVHRVGVELNTASAPLLAHVGGIGPTTAERIVAYRDQNGVFKSREQLKKVKGLGPKSFELAAGFIRLRDGAEPLDATAIHPESYTVARKIVRLSKGSFEDLSLDDLAGQVDCALPTLKDIVEQLQKPGRDPREELPRPILRTGVLTMSDLYPGLVLKGTVRNVVDFGAFIDIGVKQDGLVHRSKLRGRSLSVGQVIDVEILEVDEKRGRISLGVG
jgi:protein Tex